MLGIGKGNWLIEDNNINKNTKKDYKGVKDIKGINIPSIEVGF